MTELKINVNTWKSSSSWPTSKPNKKKEVYSNYIREKENENGTI